MNLVAPTRQHVEYYHSVREELQAVVESLGKHQGQWHIELHQGTFNNPARQADFMSRVQHIHDHHRAKRKFLETLRGFEDYSETP